MWRCSRSLGRFTFGDRGRCLSLFSSALTRTLGGFRSSSTGLSISLCSLCGLHHCNVAPSRARAFTACLGFLPERTSPSIYTPLVRAIFPRAFLHFLSSVWRSFQNYETGRRDRSPRVCPYPLCQELPLNTGMPRPWCCST